MTLLDFSFLSFHYEDFSLRQDYLTKSKMRAEKFICKAYAVEKANPDFFFSNNTFQKKSLH